MKLYLGGAPGFKPGDLIEPHPSKHVDGCAWCASGADDSHAPDRVFGTTFRLYAKFYASKYVRGWLYIVEPEGELEPSTADPFECYSAPAMRVVKVSERAVELNPSERRHLWKEWRADDLRTGRMGPNFLQDRMIKRMLGIPL